MTVSSFRSQVSSLRRAASQTRVAGRGPHNPKAHHAIGGFKWGRPLMSPSQTEEALPLGISGAESLAQRRGRLVEVGGGDEHEIDQAVEIVE